MPIGRNSDGLLVGPPGWRPRRLPATDEELAEREAKRAATPDDEIDTSNALATRPALSRYVAKVLGRRDDGLVQAARKRGGCWLEIQDLSRLRVLTTRHLLIPALGDDRSFSEQLSESGTLEKIEDGRPDRLRAAVCRKKRGMLLTSEESELRY